MQQSGLEPNVFTYNVAINACEKGRDPTKTQELLEGMQRIGLEPYVITYNASISACEKGARCDHLQCNNQRMWEES